MRRTIVSLSLLAAAVSVLPAQSIQDRLRDLGEIPISERSAEERERYERRQYRERIVQLLPELNKERLRDLPDNSEELRELYAYRLNSIFEVNFPWQELIDQDILTRAAAADVCAGLLVKPRDFNDRSGVIDWVYNHSEVSWARRILDAAVQLYKRDKGSLESVDIRCIARLAAKLGDASHLDLLSDIQKSYNVGLEEHILKKRLGLDPASQSSKSSERLDESKSPKR
ncbi:hypothetical protein [Verrucomicrobium sp. BvORR106]|uniref:hypothetical protein n=1 Tax=Verrucomicrobium sp. BvORR106 TaxID=1403819 RepID=UPI002240FA4A|nr:hypothetical protein [Verrucomicrobium sp. BvORR106]